MLTRWTSVRTPSEWASAAVLSRLASSTRIISSTTPGGSASSVRCNVVSALYAGRTTATFFPRITRLLHEAASSHQWYSRAGRMNERAGHASRETDENDSRRIWVGDDHTGAACRDADGLLPCDAEVPRFGRAAVGREVQHGLGFGCC